METYTNGVNTFDVHEDTIWIYRKDWEKAALATFRKDYFEELRSHVWGVTTSGYPTNQTLGGGLHRYMMRKWYGNEVLEAFSKAGYVVDHMNNDHMDCRIENLEFLKKDYNTAKGQQFDKDREKLLERIAVSIFKDFGTGCYQITIGCNDPIVGYTIAGEMRYVQKIKLLYSYDTKGYPIVINDAENILLEYESKRQINLTSLHAIDKRIEFSPDIVLSEDEAGRSFIERDGEWYIVMGNGKNYINAIAPDKGWKPTN